MQILSSVAHIQPNFKPSLYFVSLDDYLTMLSIVDDYSMFVYYFEIFKNFVFLIFVGARGFFESWRKNTKNEQKLMLGLIWSCLVNFNHFS